MRIIIAGAGEVGFHLARLLAKELQDIVIIDQDEERLEYAENHLDVFTLKGDATCPRKLRDAKIDKTDLLIAATSTEAHNIAICIIGKKMGAKRTIARISNSEFLKKDSGVYLKDMGIDFIISPEMLAANEIERLVKRISFTDSFEFDNGLLHLVGIRLDEASPLLNKKVSETADLNPDIDFIPVAIKRKASTIIPRGDHYFEKDDFVYFISKPTGLDIIASLSGMPKIKPQNIMILGGSRIGIKSAKKLSEKYKVKLIEQNAQKCYDLADSLEDVLIINGDGRNVELLEEENIDNMDVFIAVTGTSATNIMSCLVAKAHGVKKTIALVENIDYINLSQRVGIDTMINKKLIAASNIFRHIRAGEVLSLANLHGVDAEILEFKVKPGSKILKDTIRNLSFPKNAILGGVIRNGEGFITQGAFRIEEDDHVVVFAMTEAIPQVENFFK
jgi:trk system potassium uptake protein